MVSGRRLVTSFTPNVVLLGLISLVVLCCHWGPIGRLIADPREPLALILSPEETSTSINAFVWQSLDPSGTKSPQEIWEQHAFAPLSARLDFGYSSANHWFFLRLENPSDEAQTRIVLLNNSMPAEAKLFTLDSHSIVPMSSELRLRRQSPAFEVKVEAHTTQTLLFKIRFSHQIHASFSMSTRDKLLTQDMKSQIPIFLCYGVYAGLFIYNLLLFFAVRGRPHLYYVQFLGTIVCALFIVNGFIFPIFGIDASPGLAAAYTNFTLFFAGLFTRKFLELKARLPRWDRLIVFFLSTAMILGILLILDLNVSLLTYITDINLLATSGLALGASGKLLKQGFRPAGYYLVSWSFALSGLCFWFLDAYALIPSLMGANFALNLGLAFQMILLSFALGESLAVTRKNLFKQVSQSHKNLEKTVSEKELEAQQKSESLAQALSQVDESLNELRQLTHSRTTMVSDLAHRSNNPLHVGYLTLEALKIECSQLKSNLFQIFDEVAEQDEESRIFIHQLRQTFQQFDAHLSKLDINLDRIRQAILEIRVMSGVDGFHLRFFPITDAIEAALDRLNEAAQGVVPHRIQVDRSHLHHIKIFSNPLALTVVSERLFRELMRILNSDLKVSASSHNSPDDQAIVNFDFSPSGEDFQFDDEVLQLLNDLSYSLKPFGLTFEVHQQSKQILLVRALKKEERSVA